MPVICCMSMDATRNLREIESFAKKRLQELRSLCFIVIAIDRSHYETGLLLTAHAVVALIFLASLETPPFRSLIGHSLVPCRGSELSDVSIIRRLKGVEVLALR